MSQCRSVLAVFANLLRLPAFGSLTLLALLAASAAGLQPESAGPKPAGSAEKAAPESPRIKSLTEQLHSKDELAVREGLDTATRMGSRAAGAVPAIVELLEHSDSRIRLAAARALIDLDTATEAAVNALRAALKDPDAAVRSRTASLIGEIANPPYRMPSCWGPPPPDRIAHPAIGKRAAPSLIEALADSEPKVRAEAAWVLGRIGVDSGAATALTKAAEDKDRTVRACAIKALGNLGAAAKGAVPILTQALGDAERPVAIEAADSLRRIDSEVFRTKAVPFLLAAIRSHVGDGKSLETEERRANIQSRGGDRYVLINPGSVFDRLGPESVALVPTLCELLQDPNPYIRLLAARNLKFGPAAKEAVPALVKLLDDADRDIRLAATATLGTIGPAAVVAPALIKTLDDTDHNVRKAAVQALGDLKSAEAAGVPALIKSLADKEERVRSGAAYALGGMGAEGRAAIPVLLRLLKEKEDCCLDGGVPRAAAWALGELRAEPKTVVPALVEVLKHEQYAVREIACRSLGKFGGEAKAALPAIMEILKHDDYLVLIEAASAVKQIDAEGLPATVAKLVAALRDADPEIRRTVCHSLALLDGQGVSIAELTRMVRDGDEARYAAVYVLGTMGPKAKSAVPVLIKLFENGSELGRREVGEALLKIDPEAADRAGAE